MKNVFLFSIILFFSSFIFKSDSTTIKGFVLDKDGQGLVAVSVTLKKDGTIIQETMSTFGGAYEFRNVSFDTYEIQTAASGFKQVTFGHKANHLSSSCSQDITLFEVRNEPKEKNHTILSDGSEPITIRAYKTPIIEMDCTTTSGSIVSADEIRALPTKSINAIASSSAGLKSTSRDCSVRGSREGVSTYYVDGIRISKISLDEELPASTKKKKETKAGQITAGEWNDLHQWESWKELLADNNYKKMSSEWKVSPRERYAVVITNKNHNPIPNVEVTLFSDDDKIIWQALTDNSGKAELWNGVYEDQYEASYIEATHASQSQIQSSISEIADGSNSFIFDVDCQEINHLEVMFVVDATGSMGDEIQFLKAEIKDVIGTVQQTNEALSIKTGAVFYRDQRDKYLTKVSNLTSDLETTSSFIHQQNAQGGGDYPEAVEEGLQKALQQNWTKDQTSRIIFLVLDAPPHKNEEVLKTIQKQMQHAARLGIKIIPVTASGIKRPAEFLMKYMAILTNGTYVFITDHSGIGSAHLAPVVNDYEVEKLNDLMIRLLTQYSRSHECDVQDQTTLDYRLYPNPANQYITIDLENNADAISIHSASGMMVLKLKDVAAGKQKIDLNNLVAGMYTVRVLSEGLIKTKSFIKVRA